MKKIPVILDTDIGTDIDDTWALAMLLKSPELDLKLVVTDTNDTVYRAKIAAKMLEVAGRTDVDVGVGIPFPQPRNQQAAWVAGYHLASYPGAVHDDGVAALIDTIMRSPEPVTLICIGPVPNIAAALEREPRIARNARFVGMHGSVRRGYQGSAQVHAEYNVKEHTKSCQKAFTAPWEMTITPLDTCGLVTLDGERYRRVRQCSDPLVHALMQNYDAWTAACNLGDQAEHRSSVLFDTVAVYLAFTDELLVMEDLPIRVTDDGFTRIDPAGKMMRVATDWKDLPAYEDFLVSRLTG